MGENRPNDLEAAALKRLGETHLKQDAEQDALAQLRREHGSEDDGEGDEGNLKEEKKAA